MLVLKQIIENDLCIACGACKLACQYSNIAPCFSVERGSHEVVILNTCRCIGCSQPCATVCPSVTVDFIENSRTLNGLCFQQDQDFCNDLPGRDGWFRSIYLAWSPKYSVDNISSSGGVIRSIIEAALNAGTPVVSLAFDAVYQEYRPRLITKVEDMQIIPGSIYHSTSFVGAIDLIRESHCPVVLVALPCQLSGLLRYMTHNENALAKKIKLVVGIVCGWTYSHHSITAFAKFNNIKDPEIQRTTYRGGNRIGNLKIFSQGEQLLFSRRNHATLKESINYQASFSTDFNRLRCRICEDHLNLNADIIAADAWLSRNVEKKSLIGCRTRRGELALHELESLGLTVLEPSSFKDVIESQSANLVFGDVARKISRLLKAKGIATPLYGYREDDLVIRVSFADRIMFHFEVFRRYLARRHYFSYRAIYFLRRQRIVLSYIRLKANIFR